MPKRESPEPCWYHRFSDDPCSNPGRWRPPHALCVGHGAGFLAATRWCDDHRHATDVLDEEAPDA